MRRGLGVGFNGEPVPHEWWQELKGRIDLARMDAQEKNNVTGRHISEIASEPTPWNINPFVVTDNPERLFDLPVGCDVEHRNEPDLEGPPVAEYVEGVKACVDIVVNHRPDLKLWVGCVSNLNERGFDYLRGIPWASIPSRVGCSFHRYPDNRGFHHSHMADGFLRKRPWTREREINELKRIVGARPIGCSEVGYNTQDFTEEQAAENFALELALFERMGLDFAIAYQINDGAGPGALNRYGFRRIDGSWKPQAESWFYAQGIAPKPFMPPTVIPADTPTVAPLPPEEPPVAQETETQNAVGRLEDFYANHLPEANRPAWRETPVDPEGYGWMRVYFWHRAAGDDHERSVNKMLDAIRQAVGHAPPVVEPQRPVEPPPVGPRRIDMKPLVGFLRRGPNNSFADDSGPRRVGVCSWFPALRIFRDTPDEAMRQMDRMVGRWQGARVFWHLADPWWKGLEVDPKWHNFDALFRLFLEQMWARGLRVSLTCGDMQYIPSREHRALYRRIAQLCADVNQQVVCLSGMVNEARVNSNEKEDWTYWAGLSREWQQIYPWGQHGLSDPGDQEEPAGLIACSREPATVALLHGTRHTPVDAIRRAFNVRYEAHIGKPIVEDEPTGTGDDVYQPVDDPAWLFGIYTMKIITGQMVTFFGGAALRNRQSLESDWGFTQLPALWNQMGIPEDIGTWELTPGHRNVAPLGVRTFADQGIGPHRVDQAVSGNMAIAVVYGGVGEWRLFSRLWDAHYRVFSHSGILAEGHVRRGEDLTQLNASHRALVVVLTKE
jgi:hypothetical protein